MQHTSLAIQNVQNFDINNIFLYSLNTIINMIKSFAYLKNNLDGQFIKCVFLKMKVYKKMKVQKGNTMEQPNITGLVDHDILLETKN